MHASTFKQGPATVVHIRIDGREIAVQYAWSTTSNDIYPVLALSCRESKFEVYTEPRSPEAGSWENERERML